MAKKQGSRKNPVFVRQLDRAARRHVFIVAALRLAGFLAIILVLYFAIPIGGFNEDNPAAAWIRLAGVLLVFVSACDSIAHDYRAEVRRSARPKPSSKPS
jgi:hypothetical protein